MFLDIIFIICLSILIVIVPLAMLKLSFYIFSIWYYRKDKKMIKKILQYIKSM